MENPELIHTMSMVMSQSLGQLLQVTHDAVIRPREHAHA